MAKFVEFLGNHWLLTSLWMVLFLTLIFYLKAKSGKSVSTHQATLLINREDGVLLDIRERKEFEKGHIVDAINIPLAKLGERMVELEKYRELPLIVVCQLGQHSGEAVKQLTEKGFTQVCRMSGGIAEWQSQSLPLVK